MDESTLQRQIKAATVYEEFFVPALFHQFAAPTLSAAGIGPGHRVLDVACGTGVAARSAATLVGSQGRVIGLDPNPGMLTVARQVSPDIEWREGVAEAIPYPDASFDAVVCQFGLMFFEDRARGLREMRRVLKPTGLLSVSVWDSLDNIPAYSILVALIHHLVGKRAADALRTPFVLGDSSRLANVFGEAGMAPVAIATHQGRARYPSVRSWVLTDIKGWFPLVDVVLEPSEYETLLDAAEGALTVFTTPTGSVDFPISIHVASFSAP